MLVFLRYVLRKVWKHCRDQLLWLYCNLLHLLLGLHHYLLHLRLGLELLIHKLVGIELTHWNRNLRRTELLSLVKHLCFTHELLHLIRINHRLLSQHRHHLLRFNHADLPIRLGFNRLLQLGLHRQLPNLPLLLHLIGQLVHKFPLDNLSLFQLSNRLHLFNTLLKG